MPFFQTPIKDLLIFEPQLYYDERGFFFESFNHNTFVEQGVDVSFVQDNQSSSKFGTLRGLHFQKPPFTQAKLVRVLKGEILDVVVDLREGSATFGEHYSIILSETNAKQLFIPRGFAHGFVVLSDFADFFYKCDNYYSKYHEGGIKFDDKSLSIDWIIKHEHLLISGKDQKLGSFSESPIFFKKAQNS